MALPASAGQLSSRPLGAILDPTYHSERELALPQEEGDYLTVSGTSQESDQHHSARLTSWVDSAERFLRSAPLPWWLYLLLVSAVLVATEVGLLLIRDGLAFSRSTITYQMIIYAFLPPYAFGLLFVLDRRAESAIERLRPLIAAKSDWRALASDAANMPFWPALTATLAGLASFLLLRTLNASAGEVILAGTTQSTKWVRLFEGTMLWSIAGVGVYHTVRQLRAIGHIYSHHVDIDLLNQLPLYGLASVSAFTSIGFIIAPSIMFVLLPRLLTDELSLAVALALFAIAALAFLAPLYRLHQALDSVKSARLGANSGKLESLIRQLHSQVGTSDLERVGQTHEAMEALKLERDIISSARTWPWPPASIRGTLATFLLPIAIWVIQQLLQPAFG